MRVVAIDVVIVAIVTILVWGFFEAIDDMLDSNSEEYQKGVEECEKLNRRDRALRLLWFDMVRRNGSLMRRKR